MVRYKDITGEKFGKLTVISSTDERKGTYMVWLCQCECGNTIKVNTNYLRSGIVKHCGCAKKDGSLDLTGMRFGSLTAIRKVENKDDRTQWLCKCDCGNEKVVKTHELRNGNTKSCGCKINLVPAFRDLTGQRINMLTVNEKTDRRDAKGSIIWRCTCDCGKECYISEDVLTSGNRVSCGCHREEQLKQIHDQLHLTDNTIIERLGLRKGRSSTGISGVYKLKNGKYRAMIGFQGKRYDLGTYKTLEEAVSARERGLEMHFDYLEKYYKEHPEVKRKKKTQ